MCRAPVLYHSTCSLGSSNRTSRSQATLFPTKVDVLQRAGNSSPHVHVYFKKSKSRIDRTWTIRSCRARGASRRRQCCGWTSRRLVCAYLSLNLLRLRSLTNPRSKRMGWAYRRPEILYNLYLRAREMHSAPILRCVDSSFSLYPSN